MSKAYWNQRKRRRKRIERQKKRKRTGGFCGNSEEWTRSQEILQRAYDAAWKDYEAK